MILLSLESPRGALIDKFSPFSGIFCQIWDKLHVSRSYLTNMLWHIYLYGSIFGIGLPKYFNAKGNKIVFAALIYKQQYKIE